MPITAKLGLQALCQPSAQSPSLIFPTPSYGSKRWGLSLVWAGDGSQRAAACPRHGGRLQSGAAPGYTPGGERSRKPWALPHACLQTLRPPAQANQPPSSLYPCHGGGNRLRGKQLAQLRSREGGRRGARRVLGAALWAPSADLVGPLSISAFGTKDQCSHLGRGALEGMWHSSARTGLDSEPGLRLLTLGSRMHSEPPSASVSPF